MALKPYLLGPYETGQQDDTEPWLLPEEAFQTLENAYVWRSRVVKRPGTELIGGDAASSRLRMNVGTTDGAGKVAAPINLPGAVFKVGQNFSIGSQWFTVTALGTPTTCLSTGAADLTLNTTTGVLDFGAIGADPTTDIYWYPAEPVMGLRTVDTTDVNQEDIIAFDTQFAYRRTSGAWENVASAVPAAAADTWTGSDSDFFWSVMARGATLYDRLFWVVNGVDPIRYLTPGGSTWTAITPTVRAGVTLTSAQIIVQFKNRILVLNTTEDDGTPRRFPNRARWSQNGDPVTAPTTAWLETTPGVGGYTDASTTEAIVTAELLRDRLVVYFERSTWELVYTGNQILPFVWQQLNSELGVESQFSIVGFDTAAIGVGNTGVHSTDGANVARIDQKIPDAVFRIHNGSDGPARVYGIRDYYREMVYWTFPAAENNPVFPNRILAYNYRNQSWAFFDDNFTCFGYFQSGDDLTWENALTEWGQTHRTWNSPEFQSEFAKILAGNQQGWTVYFDPEITSNDQSLSITDYDVGNQYLVVIDHGLLSGDYVRVEDSEGETVLNDQIFRVVRIDDDNISLENAPTIGAGYTGNGKLRRIAPINMLTKQFNPGTPVGKDFSIPYVDMYLDRTTSGEFSLDVLIDASEGLSVQDATDPSILLGSPTVQTYPEAANLGALNVQTALWHRYFANVQSSKVQFHFYLSNAQARDFEIASQNFVLQAMLVYAEGGGRITS